MTSKLHQHHQENSKNNNTELHNKKNLIVQKLSLHFLKKFSIQIKQKKYSTELLNKDISDYMDNLESNLIEYNYIISNLEIILKQKLNINNKSQTERIITKNEVNQNIKKTEPKNLTKSYEIINNLLNNTNKQTSTNKNFNNEINISSNYNIINEDNLFKSSSSDKILPIKFSKIDKLKNLNEKANLDEWGLIAKYNNIKHIEEIKNKKNTKEVKTKLIKEILDSQMKERDQQRKIKQEEDLKFLMKQNIIDKNLENKFLDIEKEKLEKIKFQKEFQEKIIKGNFFLKKRNKRIT